MAAEGSAIGRPSLSLLLALILGGLAGIWFRYPIFFKLDFVFGSIFALLALQYLGIARGVVAAAAIGSYTLFLSHHPLGLLLMTAEVAVVGWLSTRRRMELVLADTLYWIFLGIPLCYGFYRFALQVPAGQVHLTVVQQALNGICNALVARLIFAGHSLASREQNISLREILYNLLALFVLGPALVVIAAGSQSDFTETDRSIRSSLLRDSRRISNNLEHWLNARKVLALNLADLAAKLPPGQMQARLEQARASDLYLLRIGLHDRDAVTVAHAPLTDETGASNLGKSFADRPFIPTLKRTLKPMLSELVQGKIDAGNPRVLMLAPVVDHGAYAGYIAGVLNLDRVHTILEENVDGQGMLYTLLDNNGRTIITNRKGQQTMAPLSRGKGELRRLDAGLSQWFPALPAGTPEGERWRRSYYLKKSAVGNFGEWDLVLEQPVAPFQSQLDERYARKLSFLLALFLVALGGAELLSRAVDSCLARMRSLTRDLPARVARGEEIRWLESPVREVRDLIGTLRQMTGDLTARYQEVHDLNENLEKRVAARTRELSELNRDFVTFLENTSDFIYFKDENSRIRFCSQTVAAITGHADWRDLLGKHDSELFPEETARLYIEEEIPIFRDGTPVLNRMNPYYDARGRLGWVSTNKWPVFDPSGRVAGIFGISRDVTELVQIQQSLQLARQSLDQVPDPVIWVDLSGRIVDCNQGTCRSLGYGSEELVGGSIFSVDPFVSPESWAGFLGELEEKGSKRYESRYWSKDGRVIPVDVFVTRISLGEDEFICGIARDISGRVALEERWHASEARLNRAHRMARLRSWEWDPETDQVVFTDDPSPGLAGENGRLAGTLASLVHERVHPEDRSPVLESVRRAREEGIAPVLEYRVMRDDGSLKWIRSTGEFAQEPGQKVRLVGVNQDVTERKRVEGQRLDLERRMLHLQKLESLGMLSGGIAHDFNNLLQVVLGNLDLSLMLLPEGASVRKNLEQAVIATVRASELSGMMLAYSGKGVLTVSRLNLSGLLQENSAVLAAVVAPSASFSTSLAQQLPPVQGDATQLLQVVMNLLKNASEALGEGGGSITLSTGTDDLDQATLELSRVEEKLQAGRYVWIEVCDTGCGMDEDTSYRVFDPFFTTKFTGRGLGMSATLGIVRAHRGAILLESQPGVGTRIRLLFPVAGDPLETPAQLPEPSQVVPAAAGARPDTVLIVDDEEMIRTLSVAMLEAFGLETLVAPDGERALEIFRSEGNRISLVLLDQSMPIMDGVSVFKELRRIRPDIRVLLASGYTRQEVAVRFQGLDLDGFIQKPFNVKNLWEEVQRVLKRP